MKLNTWIKINLIVVSIVTITACAHKKYNDPAAINDANLAYASSPSAEHVGLGEERRFGEQAVVAGEDAGVKSDRILSKRIYYFDFDSNVVHESDKPAIIANAEYLIAHPRAKIMLEGHTDPRGSREYNIGLGERRAKAVAKILTARGVNPSQIHLVSYGAEKLASPGRTEADYQRDRRVVLVYIRR